MAIPTDRRFYFRALAVLLPLVVGAGGCDTVRTTAAPDMPLWMHHPGDVPPSTFVAHSPRRAVKRVSSTSAASPKSMRFIAASSSGRATAVSTPSAPTTEQPSGDSKPSDRYNASRCTTRPKTSCTSGPTTERSTKFTRSTAS